MFLLVAFVGGRGGGGSAAAVTTVPCAVRIAMLAVVALANFPRARVRPGWVGTAACFGVLQGVLKIEQSSERSSPNMDHLARAHQCFQEVGR